MGNIHDSFVDALLKAMHEEGRPFTDEEVQKSLDHTIPKIVEYLLETLEADTPDMLNWQKNREQEFNERLAVRWEKGFDLMTKLGVMCRETGEITLKEFRPTVDSSEAYKFEALSRLHARACLIYMEALCLLKGGFADGAMARWRSLHEIATIAFFLSKENSELSERYLRHQFVEKKKKLRSYKENEERLGLEPYGHAQEKLIDQEYQRSITKFGDDFKGDYGWAAAILNKRNPTFWDIEQEIGMSHLRPYYKWACEKIHASTNGLYKSLGLDDNEEIMLAGASNYGLTDPAQMCAMSLYQTTAAFVAGWNNLDLIILCNVCKAAEEPIGETFLNIQREIEKDEKALRMREEGRGRKEKRKEECEKAKRNSDGVRAPEQSSPSTTNGS